MTTTMTSSVELAMSGHEKLAITSPQGLVITGGQWPPTEADDVLGHAIWKALCERHTEPVQQKLAAAAVAIAGLGGLGSNIAVALARIGVGHLRLIDFDTVDMTNLNRQYYFIDSLGKSKTEALRQVLTTINPNIRIETMQGKVTPAVVPEWFGGFPLVCEAFDKADQKAMLVTAVRRLLPQAIVVSGNGMAGCGHNEQMKTRQITEHLYMCGDGVTGPKPGTGLMAPRVALCAAQMANVVTALILGHDVGALDKI